MTMNEIIQPIEIGSVTTEDESVEKIDVPVKPGEDQRVVAYTRGHTAAFPALKQGKVVQVNLKPQPKA